jgi:integrase
MKDLTKTPTANLYRASTGTYFMHAKILGSLVRVSLGVKSYEIAKSKLRLKHAKETDRIFKARESVAVGDGTVGALMASFVARNEVNPKLKPKSKKLYAEYVSAIKATWPTLAEMDADAVRREQCRLWADGVRTKYSAPRHNGMVQTLQAIFNIGVTEGSLLDNPAAKLHKASVKQKELHLPSQAQFQEMLKFLDVGMRRKKAAIVVRFLAFSGMRLSEAASITPAMVDLDRGEFRLPGSITKNGKERRVPIIPEMRPLLCRLLDDYKTDNRTGPILPCRDPLKSLQIVCRMAGIPVITNHDLRHLFTTRCIESGVDVKTIASWLGHQDGGALILKTYAHLRNEHSLAMAAKVRFG